MIDIPGDYLEGGGQILRTASALSCISKKPIRVFNIRAKRPSPGLKSQHLYTLNALAHLFKAKTQGLELGAKEITFNPCADFIQEDHLEIDLQTAGAIGLALQPLLLVAAFSRQRRDSAVAEKPKGICFNIKGGTCGLGAVPVDYYARVVFPLLCRCGLKADIEIIKRGYYPKGGGCIKVRIEPIKEPKEICFTEPGKVIKIKVLSIASDSLVARQVAERQAKKAEEVLKEKFSVPIEIETEYADTYSVGSEINISAYTENGCILWSDVRGERGKTAETVGKEAAEKLIIEINSGAAVDFHLADNLIPWLCFLGGAIKTSQISLHAQTNLWVCELFFGKRFEITGTTVTCRR